MQYTFKATIMQQLQINLVKIEGFSTEIIQWTLQWIRTTTWEFGSMQLLEGQMMK
jgi:hypothetical protein